MLRVITTSWALLLGMGLLMLGHGLMGTLLPVRAELERFPLPVTGIMMSGYYLGLVAAPFLIPRLVAGVGHVRVFAACASVTSTTILLQALLITPWFWFVMRFVTGVALCGVYIVAESWLNGRATNETRGQLLSVYMVIQMGGLMGGQLLLATAPPDQPTLFVMVSVLFSLGLVPMLLSESTAPPPPAARTVTALELYRASPLGVVALFGIGLSQAAVYSLAPVYATQTGLSVAAISVLMALVSAGGVALQWPAGWISDRVDRRVVIALLTFAAALAAAAAVPLAGNQLGLIYTVFFLFGGLSLPLYSLGVAHANDFMRPEQMVGASGAILLVNGLGAAFGPMIGSGVMQAVGPWGLPAFLILVHGVIGLFALWRMTRRPTVPAAERGPVVPIPAQAPAATLVQEAAVTPPTPAEATAAAPAGVP